MDKPDEMLALAKRCEAATGPDRTLDAYIEMAVRHVAGSLYRYKSPKYTGSIDDALTLVPAGMGDEIEITTLYLVARVGVNLNHGNDGSPFYGSSEVNSIPLALCAAALRARATPTP